MPRNGAGKQLTNHKASTLDHKSPGHTVYSLGKRQRTCPTEWREREAHSRDKTAKSPK